jgi:hypothetical protein
MLVTTVTVSVSAPGSSRAMLVSPPESCSVAPSPRNPRPNIARV